MSLSSVFHIGDAKLKSKSFRTSGTLKLRNSWNSPEHDRRRIPIDRQHTGMLEPEISCTMPITILQHNTIAFTFANFAFATETSVNWFFAQLRLLPFPFMCLLLLECARFRFRFFSIFVFYCDAPYRLFRFLCAHTSTLRTHRDIKWINFCSWKWISVSIFPFLLIRICVYFDFTDENCKWNDRLIKMATHTEIRWCRCSICFDLMHEIKSSRLPPRDNWKSINR